MSYSIVLLADRTILPLREGGTRSLKNPAVQLDVLSEILPEDVRVYVLVGFRREDVLNSHTNFLFISNPDPQVERVPTSLAHCLKLIERNQDLVFLEADSALKTGVIESVSTSERSCVFYSACLSGSDSQSVNFFVKSDDLAFFQKTIEAGFHNMDEICDRLSPSFDVIDVESPRQVQEIEERESVMASFVFDQQ